MGGGLGPEVADSTVSRAGRKVSGRFILLLAVGVPLAALVALLAWALVRSGGLPGGVGINNRLGEVRVRVAPAPDFSLPLFDGDALTLASLRGKVVMVDFWASWCPPCREEASTLAQVYREYRERGVEFVGIDVWDTEEGAREYLRRFGITYPNGIDAKGKITIDYGVRGIPEKFFIDKEGRLVRKFVGPMDAPFLRSLLDRLLGI